jgi:LuxR family transcriptional regulator, maltose regulon positive regulatory protein
VPAGRRGFTRRSRPHDADAARGAPRFAKLTRPRLHAAYPRVRLFDTLDRQASKPVLWIAGAPGAGKTTLVATWMEERELPGIWYQIDPGDSDPATFFYYLRQAAEAAGAKGTAPLPLLTPEYLADVEGFTRRWFRELFVRLPEGAVVVLDQFQELPAGCALHRVLATASREVPEGAQIIVISWADPPAELSSLVAGERLARIRPEALKLTVEEAEGIASASGGLTPTQAREIRALCDGWAAGFILLRERTARTGLVNRLDERGSMRGVFDYFLAQAFRDAPQQARETLVRCAIPPRFTEEMARELSGREDAGDLLESLHRRHLFVERRYGSHDSYEYHQLFRTFLLDQARRMYPPAELAGLFRRAAALLERAGLLEEAVELLREGGDHDGAARLVEELAPRLVACGRGASFRRWVTELPPDELDRRPWVSYWLGIASTGASLRDSRSAYERAYAGFMRDANAAGQVMAAAGVLETHLLEMDQTDRFERWLSKLQPLLAEEPSFPSDDLAARVYGTLVSVIIWSAPAHPLLPACVRRLEELLARPLEPEVKVTAGGQLAEYYGVSGFVREGERIFGAIEPVARDPAVSPLARAFWYLRTARTDYVAANFRQVRAKLDCALGVAKENGVAAGMGLVYSLQLSLALDLGDAEPAPAPVEEMRAWIRGRGRQGVGLVHWMEARLAAHRGELERAERECEAACSVAAGTLPLASLLYETTLASILIERGELERARSLVAPLRSMFPVDRFPYQVLRLDAVEAVLADAAGEPPEWTARLRDSLRRVQRLGAKVLVYTQPLLARQLARVALNANLETPYVQACIRRVGLRPPPADVPRWPWPVSIRTLGAFRIALDGVPLTFDGKRPRRPLELLQAVIAFGRSEVPLEKLCASLWPDSEGDAAESALRVTLSRLRKLLGHERAILHHGTLSLDEGVCWVDVWSLERLFAEIDAGAPSSSWRRLLELYGGAFLEREREQHWMLQPRQRLRERFVAAAGTLGEALEHEGRHEEAVTLYRSAVDLVPQAAQLRPRLAAALGQGRSR